MVLDLHFSLFHQTIGLYKSLQIGFGRQVLRGEAVQVSRSQPRDSREGSRAGNIINSFGLRLGAPTHIEIRTRVFRGIVCLTRFRLRGGVRLTCTCGAGPFDTKSSCVGN